MTISKLKTLASLWFFLFAFIYAMRFFNIFGSYAAGILISIIFVVVVSFSYINYTSKSSVLIIVFIPVLILLHSIIASWITGYGYISSRAISNAMILPVLIFFVDQSVRHKDIVFPAIAKALYYFNYVLPLIALNAKFNIYAVKMSGYVMPIFPFQEPSHFFNFYVLCALVSIHVERKVTLSILGFAICMLLYPSATGLAGFLIILGSMYLNSKKTTYILLGGIIIPFVLIMALPFLDLEYYMQRLMFWNSNNLSALVYMQGAESIYKSFETTYGFGVGLGQMLNTAKETNSAHTIQDITMGQYYNLKSGGFVASQLITELGVIGCMLLFYIMKTLISYRTILSKSKVNLKIAYIFILASLTEIIFRGYGLFTPIMLLCYMGLALIAKELRVEK